METRKVVDKITERIEMYCNKDIEDLLKNFMNFRMIYVCCSLFRE